MVYEIAKDYGGDYQVFRPYYPASERGKWEGLPGKLKKI